MSAIDVVTVGEPLPTLAKVKALEFYRVRLTWKEGSRAGQSSEVDLAPAILSYKLFRPLRNNPSLFAGVHLVEDGAAIAWGDDDTIDMAATTLERLADEEMTSANFKAFLDRCDLTFDAAAAQLGISRRLVAYYAQGRTVPRYIALACEAISTELRTLKKHLTNKKVVHSLEMVESGAQPLVGVRLSGKVGGMSKDRLFVERRPQGDYAVRKPNSERASAVAPTQAKAIERARELNPVTQPLVERVRHTGAGSPDKWRKP